MSKLNNENENVNRNGTKWQAIFVRSAGCILVITGLAKIISVFGKQQILNLNDPIFNFPFRDLMLLAALLELGVSAICFCSVNKTASLRMIVWLASCILIYRLGFTFVGWQRPCHCMGSLTDEIHLSDQQSNFLALFILAYLLLGGCSFLFALRRRLINWLGLFHINNVNIYIVIGLILLVSANATLPSLASSPMGTWNITGNVVDVRITTLNQHVTNNLSVTGISSNGEFLIGVIPIRTEDDIAESIGWDGSLLRIIQRFPKQPEHGLPRDQSIAYIEPMVLSRYATDASAPVLMALADTNALMVLKSGDQPIILGLRRVYPEEDNIYTLTFGLNSFVGITAFTPGRELLVKNGKVIQQPIPGSEEGFTRWEFSVSNASDPSPNNLHIKFQSSRYFPSDGRLFQFRNVLGNLFFKRASVIQSDFRPTIDESNLFVRDYSSRKELNPWLRGVIDYCLIYNLTNLSWEIDQVWASNKVEEEKEALITAPLPDEIKTAALMSVTPPSATRRGIVIWALAVFSVAFFAILIIRMMRDYSTARKQHKQK